jgi:hypothetical protein
MPICNNGSRVKFCAQLLRILPQKVTRFGAGKCKEELGMSGKVIGAILGLLLAAAVAPGARAEAITEEEAHAIGVDAYLYFYSPVTMDLTRKQMSAPFPPPTLGSW